MYIRDNVNNDVCIICKQVLQRAVDAQKTNFYNGQMDRQTK